MSLKAIFFTVSNVLLHFRQTHLSLCHHTVRDTLFPLPECHRSLQSPGFLWLRAPPDSELGVTSDIEQSDPAEERQRDFAGGPSQQSAWKWCWTRCLEATTKSSSEAGWSDGKYDCVCSSLMRLLEQKLALLTSVSDSCTSWYTCSQVMQLVSDSV